jgi:hypothetical protein
MTLRELAIYRMRQNGVSGDDATAILENFVKGLGRDVPWNNTAPFLADPLADRIDRAAVNWMMAHHLTDQHDEPGVKPAARDGKMLATGEGNA